MKKRGFLLLILLLTAILIVGCASADPTEPPTDPQTVQTDPPTDPPTQPPTEISLPDAVAFYQELLQWGEDRRYSQALGCVFETPEQISLYIFFYNGADHPGSWGSLPEEERTYLLQAGLIDEMDLQIMPAQKLDATLNRYVGVGLGDVEIPAEWVYSPGSDCYYSNHNDAWGSAAQVTEVRETAEGLIRVFYTVDTVAYDFHNDEYISDASMVLTLRPMDDGSYQMISNVFA